MTDKQAEAQAALDAVRERLSVSIDQSSGHDHENPLWVMAAILAALENLDARLKALEGK